VVTGEFTGYNIGLFAFLESYCIFLCNGRGEIYKDNKVLKILLIAIVCSGNAVEISIHG
jgi:hypothetical protein